MARSFVQLTDWLAYNQNQSDMDGYEKNLPKMESWKD
jgi:hypothetical protein